MDRKPNPNTNPDRNGMPGPEQLVREVLTPEHQVLVDRLVTAHQTGNMDGYDTAMAALTATTDPALAEIIPAIQVYTAARAAQLDGNPDTASAYRQFAESRFTERILTTACILALLGVGLREGQLIAWEYDYVTVGLREWTGWSASETVAVPMVEPEVATAWLAAIRRVEP